MDLGLGHGVPGWISSSFDFTAVSDRGLSVCKTSFIEDTEMSRHSVQLGMVGTGVFLGTLSALFAHRVSLYRKLAFSACLSCDWCMIRSSCFWDPIPGVFHETFQPVYTTEQPGLTGSTPNSQETNLDAKSSLQVGLRSSTSGVMANRQRLG